MVIAMMKQIRLTSIAMLLVWLAATTVESNGAYAAETGTSDQTTGVLENEAYRISASIENGTVLVSIYDLLLERSIADGPCLYHAVGAGAQQGETVAKLENPSIAVKGTTLTIRGRLLGLDLKHRFTLPKDRRLMEERVIVRNNTDAQIALEDLEVGPRLRVTDENERVLPEFADDRLVAVPFRHCATDAKGFQHDFSMQEVVDRPGRETCMDSYLAWYDVPSRHRASEGWAWTCGKGVLCIFKFCQEHMQFSVVSVHRDAGGGAWLRFGGAAMISGEPAALCRIAPGQTVNLGEVRYQSLRGGHTEALYAFRTMLDEHGCHFPKDYNPPVHWEQLYDMPDAWRPPRKDYDRAAIEKEAAKGRAYSCESLYLDPGWDTAFGSFIWAEERLGPRKEFIEHMQSEYGLKVSLHCPLATWVSNRTPMGPRADGGFPPEARRTPPTSFDGHAAVSGRSASLDPKWPAFCLGSKQYLAMAEERLLANCADGIVFIMFDGNRWNGGCLNPNHGHPVPYRKEDHVRATLDLAQRIHAKYPNVLIEMHDMIVGGNKPRPTPIYYKYGLPGSFDENWGFELMWNPMEDIVEGRTAALYYANMGCNIPIYTHVTLACDNEHCLVLWWFASTCRHLGIGGTHADPKIVEAQQQAMKWYRAHERFYKRGEFYGLGEEIHLHVLPEENAFTVNAFNLTDKPRVIEGSVDLATLGLKPDAEFIASSELGTVDNGRLRVRVELPPWGAKVAVFESK